MQTGRRLIGPRSKRTSRIRRVECLEARRLLMADPLISEIQARNDTTLLDEDGDSSDWIEIHNPDPNPTSLAGWYLTDDSSDLTKWQFPEGVELSSDQRILVFASGKDRSRADSELHANFRLSADGEFLSLVKPDGVSLVEPFNPFPPQIEDGSYGLASGRDTTVLVARDQSVRVHVPMDNSSEVSWTQIEFDDSAWTSGVGGVGYEKLRAGFVDQIEFDAPLSDEWTIDNPGSAIVNVEDGRLVMNLESGLRTTGLDRGDAPIIYRNAPAYRGEPTTVPNEWSVETRVTQDEVDRGSAGIAIYDGASQLPAIVFRYGSRSRFELRANDRRLKSIRESGHEEYSLRVTHDAASRSWTGSFKLAEEDDWLTVGTLTEGLDNVPVVVDPKPALYAETPSGTMNARFDFFKVDVHDESSTYGPSTGLDVGPLFADKNTSIWMRYPFTIDRNPTEFDHLDVSLRFDDGYRAYLNGTLIAEHNAPLPPPAPADNVLPWNAVAQGTHGADRGQIPVTRINLDSWQGLLQPGPNLLAVHGLNLTANDRDFFFDTELLASELVTGKAQPLSVPTPGLPNEIPAALPPVIVGDEGAFVGTTLVEMRLSEPSPTLQIRFTRDGSEPTMESELYTSPLVLRESAMLQARVFDGSEVPELEPSSASSATFVAVASNLLEMSSDIPIILLDTLGRRVAGAATNSLTSANVVALDVSKATGRTSLGSPQVSYLGRGGVRDRGSSTAGQLKPNMTFETWGTDGTDADDDTDVALLGFSSESDWVLHAPFNFDRAMIRNQLAFALSNQVGEWAPRTRPVEVYLNRGDGIVQSDDYMGVYVLMDKITRGEGRLELAGIDPEDNQEPEVSGGYIWKIDRPDPDAPRFNAGGISPNWVHPKSPVSRTARPDQKATDEQQAWVNEYFNSIRDSLRRPDRFDPEGYTQYIDLKSWVDHHLLSVFLDDVDAFALSAYLHKDRNGKLKMGPLWDFDRSAESLDDRDDDPTLWGGSGNSNFFDRGWYASIFRDEGFWQAYVDRWTELRRTTLSVKNVDALVDELTGEIAEAQERNFAANVNRGVRPRTSSRYASGKLDGTWQGEVEHLRTWLHERLEFIDSTFTLPPQLLLAGERLDLVDADTLQETIGVRVDPGATVEIRSPDLLLFDDDVLLSGEPSAVSGTFFAPADDSLGTDWAQPDFDDSSWILGPLGVGFENSPDEYAELIKTELRPADNGTTVLARVPFELNDAASLAGNGLILRAKFDDGFVAYLNGVEVLRANVRDRDLTWDSRASSRRNSEAAEFSDFDISEAARLLVDGQNLLAIRLINQSRTSNDLMFLPELVTRRFRFEPNTDAIIYYTVDGSDPRGPDGDPAPGARRLARGESIAIDSTTRIVARNFDSVIDRGPESRRVRTDWSAPATMNFVVADPPQLVISEIGYHPVAPSAAETAAGFVDGDF